MKDYAAVARVVAANPKRQSRGALCPWAPCWWRPNRRAAQSKVGAPYLRGIVPQLETNMSVLPNSIVAGKFDVSDRGLLVGTEFARNMDLQVGDRVEIGSPSVLRKWQESTRRGDQRPGAAGIRGARDFRRRLLRIQLVGGGDLAAGRAGVVRSGRQRARVDGDAARPVPGAGGREGVGRCAGARLRNQELDGGELEFPVTP